MITPGMTVVQQTKPITGQAVDMRWNHDLNGFEVLVTWTDAADGEQHERWFPADDFAEVTP